jgi:xylulokinase
VSKFLIFDLGTSYFKTCLFDKHGRLIGLCRVTSPINYGSDERAELNAETFLETLKWAVVQLQRDFGPLDDVVAVSFSTQANSFVLLGESNQPLTPFLIWNDNRARGESFPLQELAESTAFYHTTGIPSVNHQFLPAKLNWLMQHAGSSVSKACRLVCLSDYLTLWMTGKHITETSVAWLTGLVDVHEGTWWSEACRVQSIPDDWLPKMVRAGTDLGPLLPAVADELGLDKKCRFVVGCLDQFAGAIGAGNVRPGMVSETTGTVLATVRCVDRFDFDRAKDIFQGPAASASQFYQMVFSDISGAVLEGYRNSLSDRPTFAVLDGRAAHAGSANGLKWRRCADGETRFENQKSEHTSGHEVYAIMEAVAEELANQVEVLCGNEKPEFIRSAGGAAASELWQQIKSDKVGCSVEATTCKEPTSLGAAILAAHAIDGTPIEYLARDWVLVNSAVAT